MKILNGHNSFDTAYLVNDYPYGFNLRTQVKYWIESNNKGDRLIFCSLNPKTNKWNTPKKSTYCSIEVLYIEENTGYVKSKGINAGWDNEDKLNQFLAYVGSDFKFNEYQLKQITRIKAISRVQKHITVTCVNSTNWTKEQETEHKKEQDKVKQNIGLLYVNELNNAQKEV